MCILAIKILQTSISIVGNIYPKNTEVIEVSICGLWESEETLKWMLVTHTPATSILRSSSSLKTLLTLYSVGPGRRDPPASDILELQLRLLERGSVKSPAYCQPRQHVKQINS